MYRWTDRREENIRYQGQKKREKERDESLCAALNQAALSNENATLSSLISRRIARAMDPRRLVQAQSMRCCAQQTRDSAS